MLVEHSSVYEPFSALHLTTRQKCTSAVHGAKKCTSYCLKSLNAAKWGFRWRLPQPHVDFKADVDKKTMEETVSFSSLQKVEAQDLQAHATESEDRPLTGSALNVARVGFAHLGVCFMNHNHEQKNQGLKTQEGAQHGSGSQF